MRETTSKETISKSAASFLEAGIALFDQHDFLSALVFLDAAGKLYSGTDNQWNASVARAWYRSAETKLSDLAQKKDEFHVGSTG